MSSKTVNEDLMIVTQRSKHVADCEKPSDECYLVDKKTVKGFRNYIKTSACSNGQATKNTFIRSARIIHSKSKIGQTYGFIPSFDDDFAGWGGGVNNGGVFFRHANDLEGSHSKNVKVEGNWIVRTNDETQQNNANCNGKFVEGDGGVTVEDLEALLSKGCTVESVTMKCDHREATVVRLSVLEGDKVTITMVHVNDAEVEKEARAKPICQVPRRKKEGKLPEDAKEHPYYRVTRSAYPATSWREALPALTKEMPGLKIVLEEEWLGKKLAEDEKDSHIIPGLRGLVEATPVAVATDPKEEPEFKKYDSYNTSGTVERAPVEDEGQRLIREQREDGTGIAAQQERGRAEANAALARDAELRMLRESFGNREKEEQTRRQEQEQKRIDGREKVQAAKKIGAIGITTYYALTEIFWAKPVEIKVEALACAGAKPVTIAAYPPGKYAVNLVDLKEVKNAFLAIKELVTNIKKFLLDFDGVGGEEEGPGGAIEVTTKRYKFAIWFLQDLAAELGVEFRELTRDSTDEEAKGRKKHEVHRAFLLNLKSERLIGVRASLSIPLAAATGALSWIQYVLDAADVDLSFKIEVKIYTGVDGAFEIDEYGKVHWLRSVTIEPFAEFTMSLCASTSFAAFEVGVDVTWKAKFELQPLPDKFFSVKLLPNQIDIKWFVKASVDIFGWTVDFEREGYIWEPFKFAEKSIELT